MDIIFAENAYYCDVLRKKICDFFRSVGKIDVSDYFSLKLAIGREGVVLLTIACTGGK